MSASFTPKRADGKAQWRVVYELAREMNFGDTLTFVTLGEALEVDLSSDMNAVYRAVRRAAGELRRHDRRSLESVEGVGYRMLAPDEHSLQARRFQKSSRRKMGTSLEVIRATELEALAESDRQSTIALGMVLQGMCQAIDGIDRRQRATEKALVQAVRDTEVRLSEQEQQMERMAQAMRAAGIMKSEP